MFARSTTIFRQPILLRSAIRAQSTAAGADATRGPVNPPQQQKGELVTREQAEHRESGLTTSAPSVEIVAADVLNDAPREYQLRSEAMRRGRWVLVGDGRGEACMTSNRRRWAGVSNSTAEDSAGKGGIIDRSEGSGEQYSSCGEIPLRKNCRLLEAS